MFNEFNSNNCMYILLIYVHYVILHKYSVDVDSFVLSFLGAKRWNFFISSFAIYLVRLVIILTMDMLEDKNCNRGEEIKKKLKSFAP